MTAHHLKSSIPQLREKAGLTQSELANVVGVSENTIANWEKGKAAKWIRHLQKLCAALGCGIQDLDSEVIDSSTNLSDGFPLSDATLRAVRNYCVAKTQDDKKTQNSITSYAIRNENEELRYWISKADSVMKEKFGANEDSFDWNDVSSTLKLQAWVERVTRDYDPRDIDYAMFEHLVKEIDLSESFIQNRVPFDQKRYRRVLLMQTWSLTVYAIGWMPGQFCGEHHHGDALDVIYVLKGTMAHRTIPPEICRKDGVPHESYRSHTPLDDEEFEQFGVGQHVVIKRRWGHQIANQSNENLITLNFRFGHPPGDDDFWVGDRNKMKPYPLQKLIMWSE